MRKRNNKGNILSRPKSQRQALLRSMTGSLFLRGRITTTQAKAKELSQFAEKCITKAKDSHVATRRFLAKELPPMAVKKAVDEIAPSYGKRQGGYTRIIKLGARKSDGAKMVIIELVK